MSVTRYVPLNAATLTFGVHPVHFVCTTTAELPSSGLKLGDTAIALDTNVQYKASSSSAWTVSGGGGGGGSSVPSQFVVKTVDENVISSTVLQNDNELFLPMAANEVWMVTGTYFADSVSATPGFKVGMTLPAGATVTWHTAYAWSTSAGTAALTLAAASTFALQLPASAAFATVPSTFRYRILNGPNAGNFQLTWAQATSDAAATVVRKYSTLAALKVA